ncbi:MAG: SGNH/GDSL hydrolase family protein [Kiritimatiellae bacterium]|nr:SGNH/GDSL hydrolase family protein [Kiritimatiellia bacterium]
MKLGNGSKLLFIGDSITDAGRARPVGEDVADKLGNGYVSMVAALLGAVCPDRAIRVLNTGISGNTVRDLKARWQTDAIDLQPDWLSVMIGINDVWRNFAQPAQRPFHVPIEEYEQTLDALLAAVRPSLKGLVLMTPYFVEPNRAEPMRAMMDRYGAVVKKLADRYDAVFADTQAAFDRVLDVRHPGTIAGDRVHPGKLGHMIIARAFLQAVAFEW